MPLVAMRHAYVVTERIEGIQNMPNMRDHDASVYLKLQGDALCVGGYEPNPIFIDQVCCAIADQSKLTVLTEKVPIRKFKLANKFRSRKCITWTANF